MGPLRRQSADRDRMMFEASVTECNSSVFSLACGGRAGLETMLGKVPSDLLFPSFPFLYIQILRTLPSTSFAHYSTFPSLFPLKWKGRSHRKEPIVLWNDLPYSLALPLHLSYVRIVCCWGRSQGLRWSISFTFWFWGHWLFSSCNVAATALSGRVRNCIEEGADLSGLSTAFLLFFFRSWTLFLFLLFLNWGFFKGTVQGLETSSVGWKGQGTGMAMKIKQSADLVQFQDT